jgi:dolichyl-phosphate-mannose--protein O-mannosyl transferase
LALTFHVVLVVALCFRPPRWRALVGLVCPPLAMFFGYREGFRGRALALSLSLVAYGLVLLLSSRP